VHVGPITALIAAGAFVLLVLLLAIPLVKPGRTLDEATLAIRTTPRGCRPPTGSGPDRDDEHEHPARQLSNERGLPPNTPSTNSSGSELQ
jgi:hypothetical protein